jgi:hypothetical protein
MRAGAGWFDDCEHETPRSQLENREPAPNETSISLVDQCATEALLVVGTDVSTPDVSTPEEITQRIDLPPHLHLVHDARLVPPPWTWPQLRERVPWADLAVWLLGVAQLALGVALGYLLTFVLFTGLLR